MTEEEAKKICRVLRRYELWRTGADVRTYEAMGLTTRDIGAAIEAAVDYIAGIHQVNDLPAWDCRKCRFYGWQNCNLGVTGECADFEEER